MSVTYRDLEPERAFVTVFEAARLAGVRKHVVYRACDLGRLRVLQQPHSGRAPSRLIRLDTLDAWIAARSRRAMATGVPQGREV
jgi:hypothetical protein